MFLKILPASTHYSIPKPVLYFQAFVTQLPYPYTKPVLVSCDLCNNSYRLGSLKEYKLIALQFWRLGAQNQCYWAEIKVLVQLFSIQKLKGKFIACLFQLLVLVSILWLVPHYSNLLTPSSYLLLCISNLHLPTPYKDKCDCI